MAVCFHPSREKLKLGFKASNPVGERNGSEVKSYATAQAEFDENAGDSFSLEELSDRTRLALHTISRILARLEPVDKTSLQFAFAAFGLELSQSDYTRPTSTLEELETRQQNPEYDWQEAPDVSVFFGRGEELLQLRSGTAYYFASMAKFAYCTLTLVPTFQSAYFPLITQGKFSKLFST